MTIDEFDTKHGPYCETDKVGFDSIADAFQKVVTSRSNGRCKVWIVDRDYQIVPPRRLFTVNEWLAGQSTLDTRERMRVEIAWEHLQVAIAQIRGERAPTIVLREYQPED